MLIEIQLSGAGTRWSYQQPVIRIGRDATCDVLLSNIDFPQVSRVHALLEVVNGALRVSDQGSTHGTFVNLEKVSQRTLVSGDRIRLGENGPEFLISIQMSPATSVEFPSPVPGDDLRTALFDPRTPPPISTRPSKTSGAPSPIDSDATSVRSLPGASLSTRIPGAGASSRSSDLDSTSVFSGDVETLRPKGRPATSGQDEIAAQPEPASRVRVGVGQAEPSLPPPAPEEKMSNLKSAVPQPAETKGEYPVPAAALGLIQKLLVANLILTVVLLLIVFQQGQQIITLKKSQEDAIQNFAPEIAQTKHDIQSSKSEFKQEVSEAEASMRNTMRDEENRVRDELQRDIPPLVEKTIRESIAKYAGGKH